MPLTMRLFTIPSIRLRTSGRPPPSAQREVRDHEQRKNMKGVTIVRRLGRSWVLFLFGHAEPALGIQHERRQTLHTETAQASCGLLAIDRRQVCDRTGDDRPGRTDLLARPRHIERPLLTRGLAEVALLHFPRRDLRCAERARPGAEAAADALARIDRDDAGLRALADGGDGAGSAARRIAAMHAGHRHVHRLDVWER